MQDAAQGFRTLDSRQIGEVTSWPCSLAVTASWDEELGYAWGKALGEEHAAKGANFILGPSVNVHRVARGGRNAEYLSGEDPALGAVFSAAYVRGVQSQNVSAVVKHYGFNNQETDRNTVDVHVTERAAFEVFYPPFKAAVDAGVGAAMCAYNVVNGSHACANGVLLDRDLKERMAFAGFVMSDWWAIHERGYEQAGLDMDMPGNDGYFSPAALSASAGPRLDNMAQRVLNALISTGVYDAELQTPGCLPPAGCDAALYEVDATAGSRAHAQLARTLASAGAVLLKNEQQALPLKAGQVVAVVGSACDAPNDIPALLGRWDLGNYYTIGGSGRVIGARPASVLAGLREQAAAAGLQLRDATAAADAAAAAAAMEGADVVLVCAATTSTEAADRASLSLDQEAFVGEVLAAAPATARTVVLLNTPGAVLVPWADQADAIALMFLAGQETGRAWADVLTGAVTPAGKLPVTLPLLEADTVAPCTRNPCVYSEGVMVGWRALENKPVAFPFGHGLSYTSFQYAWVQPPTGSSCSPGAVLCMQVQVRNTGAVAGAEVVQLYVAFPDGGSASNKLLKGFRKTGVLSPGGAATVAFSLSPRDLSTWDVAAGQWAQAHGAFTLFVGASSRALNLSATASL